MVQQLPPFPSNSEAEDFVRVDWNNRLQRQVNTGTSWSNIDFTGSSLSSISNRQHSLLTSVLGTGQYHLSSTEAGRVTACMITQSKAGIPTTSDIPAGNWAIYKNTTDGTTKLYANDAGSIVVVGDIISDVAITYSPTITSTTGTLTSASITLAKYYRVGKIIYFTVYYDITTVGTGAGFLKISLPTTATADAMISGTGNNVNGSLTAIFAAPSLNYTSILGYNGSTPCVVGTGSISGWYVSST